MDMNLTSTSAAPTGPGIATVADVLRPAVTTVETDAHLAAAAYLMKHNGQSALVVTSDDGGHRPLGVLTDADISQAVADGRDVEQTRIWQVWCNSPSTVEPMTLVQEAVRRMLVSRIEHLPVVDGGRLVGIVDLPGLCRALLHEGDRASLRAPARDGD